MAKSKSTNSPVVRGSGNVFADLGFSPREAAALKVKAELTRRIYHRIKELKLTQINAARQLGLSQPDVSKLMSGRHTGFSIDRLLALLNALHVDVRIVISPKAATDRPGSIHIDRAWTDRKAD